MSDCVSSRVIGRTYVGIGTYVFELVVVPVFICLILALLALSWILFPKPV